MMELHFVFHMVLKSPKMSHLKVKSVIFTNNWKRFIVENCEQIWKKITFFSFILVKIHYENETFLINFKQCVFFC